MGERLRPIPLFRTTVEIVDFSICWTSPEKTKTSGRGFHQNQADQNEACGNDSDE